MSSPELKIQSIEIEKGHQNNLYPSDHFPVKAIFTKS